jgi:hypothetical protein
VASGAFVGNGRLEPATSSVACRTRDEGSENEEFERERPWGFPGVQSWEVAQFDKPHFQVFRRGTGVRGSEKKAKDQRG